MSFRSIAAILLIAATLNAADVTYTEWATAQMHDFLGAKLTRPADALFFWHVDEGKVWTAGVAFVHSATLGDGLLVVPDVGENVAYLAFKQGSMFQTNGEAHACGFGFCPYLSKKMGAATIELEPDAASWISLK